MVTSSSEFNNKPRVFIQLQNKTNDYVILSSYGFSGQINAWNYGRGKGAAFSTKGKIWTISGDNNCTIDEIGGTGKNIITVGAYTSKNSYTDFLGNPHIIDFYTDYWEIAPFSSLGPTTDGRIKPNITAPGNVIVSSVNSFDTKYNSLNKDVVTGLTDGTNEWWFAIMSGTSMASPIATGIIALWLEADPTLTTSQIKEYLQSNSWTDTYTGTVPNNTWGWGKIDAHETIKKILISETLHDLGTILKGCNNSFCFFVSSEKII